jgi:hypothetical protein
MVLVKIRCSRSSQHLPTHITCVNINRCASVMPQNKAAVPRDYHARFVDFITVVSPKYFYLNYTTYSRPTHDVQRNYLRARCKSLSR